MIRIMRTSNWFKNLSEEKRLELISFLKDVHKELINGFREDMNSTIIELIECLEKIMKTLKQVNNNHI